MYNGCLVSFLHFFLLLGLAIASFIYLRWAIALLPRLWANGLADPQWLSFLFATGCLLFLLNIALRRGSRLLHLLSALLVLPLLCAHAPLWIQIALLLIAIFTLACWQIESSCAQKEKRLMAQLTAGMESLGQGLFRRRKRVWRLESTRRFLQSRCGLKIGLLTPHFHLISLWRRGQVELGVPPLLLGEKIDLGDFAVYGLDPSQVYAYLERPAVSELLRHRLLPFCAVLDIGPLSIEYFRPEIPLPSATQDVQGVKNELDKTLADLETLDGLARDFTSSVERLELTHRDGLPGQYWLTCTPDVPLWSEGLLLAIANLSRGYERFWLLSEKAQRYVVLAGYAHACELDFHPPLLICRDLPIMKALGILEGGELIQACVVAPLEEREALVRLWLEGLEITETIVRLPHLQLALFPLPVELQENGHFQLVAPQWPEERLISVFQNVMNRE